MIEQIIGAIQDSEKQGILSRVPNDILTGYSGEKLIGVMQRLVQMCTEESTCYLEIGVFQGLTLLSNAFACPEISCFGVDNFALDPDRQNFDIVKERIKKLNLNNAHVINQDYEFALENLDSFIVDKKIGVYFIDGPHDYRSQLMCLQLALPYLSENAVILVDDCNYVHVRQANRDFLITHPEYKLIFETYTPCHPGNMSASQKAEARKGWWNGVNILVRDINNDLPQMFPPTQSSRKLYENEHLIHGSYLGELAPQLIAFAHIIYDTYSEPYRSGQELEIHTMLDLISQFESLFKMIDRYKESQHIKGHEKLYVGLNTFSENLPTRYNQI